MKKLINIVIGVFFCAAAFATTDNTPEMLKKKELFDKPELYESVSIYANKEITAALLKDYQDNPLQYKTEQLMPIASAYLAFSDLENAKILLEKYVEVNPKYLNAKKLLANIYMLSKDSDKAIDLYKQLLKDKDEDALKLLCNAYLLSNQISQVKEYVSPLKEKAVDDLEVANILMLYALSDKDNVDEALLKEVLSKINAKNALQNASQNAMSTFLRIYIAKKDLFSGQAYSIAARAAAAAQAWALAIQANEEALKENPKDTIALRGMALVQYRIGDITKASECIKKAVELGDEGAISDGVELFLLSSREDIWNIFKDKIANATITPIVRAGMIQYAVGRTDMADMFYMACEGEGSDLLFKDENVKKLMEEGLKKYPTDSRALKLKEKLAK